MTILEAFDKRALSRAAKGLAPMLARRLGYGGALRAGSGERMVRALLMAKLAAIEEDDLVREPEEILWARVERSGLVLIGIVPQNDAEKAWPKRHAVMGIDARAYIVARAVGRGGRASRLLVR